MNNTSDITVIKRDGSKEPLDLKKIARVMGAAGLNSGQTEEVINTINNWLSSSSALEVSSRQIRDKLLEILPSIDKNSANLFSWYQKTKE